MKILLISGHGAGDVGACGNGYREADLTREVVNLMKDKLAKHAQVDVYNQSRNAYKDVNSGNVGVNFLNYNYVFEVHFNAGGGAGTEIFVTREESATTVEQKVMDKLANFFTVRGVKRKNFDVINSAKRKGVSSALLEVCFIDNAQDMQIYQANKEAISTTIVEAIVEGFGLKEENHTSNVVGNENNKEEFDMAKTYKNGSTTETVFADSLCTKVIGTLNTWETCECLGIVNGRYIVKYKVDNTNNYKVGFVRYSGGVK